MTSDIRIAVEHNNPGGLALFDVSPDTNGLEFPRSVDAASGAGFWDGKPFCVLRFPEYVEPAVWVAILAKAGLSDLSVRRVAVTVRIPDENKVTYTNYNGQAERRQTTTHELLWYRSPEILVTRLVEL